MTLAEAVAAGISRWRMPNWHYPNAYVRIDIIEKPDRSRTRGPWAHLFSPDEQKAIGVETPQSYIIMEGGIDDMEPYTGPIADEDDAP